MLREGSRGEVTVKRRGRTEQGRVKRQVNVREVGSSRKYRGCWVKDRCITRERKKTCDTVQ